MKMSCKLLKWAVCARLGRAFNTIPVGCKRVQTFKVVTCHPSLMSPATVHLAVPLGSSAIVAPNAIPNESQFEL